MNMSKSRGIQAKMHLNDKNSQSVFLSFKCILARNCEGTETEQLRHIYIKRSLPTLPVNSYKSSAFPLRDLKNVCIFSPYEL